MPKPGLLVFSPRSNLAALLIARALSYFARPLDYPERECYQSSARVATHAIFAARDPTIFQKIARVSAALCLIPIDRVNSEGGETDFGSRYKHSK